MDDENLQVFSLDGTLHTSFSKSVGRFKEKKDNRKAKVWKNLG
jgi:hypothetical protein